MERLELRKEGKLIDTKWIYDKEKEQGEYIEFDVTDNSIKYLFEICFLEEGVTLKDLFLLLNNEIEQFDLIFGNWLEDAVTEGLTKKAKPYGEYDKDNIEYLELYWHITQDEESFSGYHHPSFHGMGYELKEDSILDENAPIYKKGTRIYWAIEYTPTNELINIPLKLNTNFIVYDENYHVNHNKNTFMKEIISFENATYSLANIIYGVIWELSFCGGPEDREKKNQELHEIVEDINEDNITKIDLNVK